MEEEAKRSLQIKNVRVTGWKVEADVLIGEVGTYGEVWTHVECSARDDTVIAVLDPLRELLVDCARVQVALADRAVTAQMVAAAAAARRGPVKRKAG